MAINGANLDNLNASNISTGTMNPMYLPTMVGATMSDGVAGIVPSPIASDATKFLRGDATWSAALSSGQGNLDGSGQLTVTLSSSVVAVVPTWFTPSFTGTLYVTTDLSGTWIINSTVGATDSGCGIAWIAF